MLLFRFAPILAAALWCGAGTAAHAGNPDAAIIPVADADHPYSNIDRSNDAGNDTGDSQVDRLNAQQLNENYRGPYYIGRPPPPGVRPPALRPQPPPVYYRPPPPGYYYAPPPPAYYRPPGY